MSRQKNPHSSTKLQLFQLLCVGGGGVRRVRPRVRGWVTPLPHHIYAAGPAKWQGLGVRSAGSQRRNGCVHDDSPCDNPMLRSYQESEGGSRPSHNLFMPLGRRNGRGWAWGRSILFTTSTMARPASSAISSAFPSCHVHGEGIIVTRLVQVNVARLADPGRLLTPIGGLVLPRRPCLRGDISRASHAEFVRRS